MISTHNLNLRKKEPYQAVLHPSVMRPEAYGAIIAASMGYGMGTFFQPTIGDQARCWPLSGQVI
jgi:hypothetical protein